MKDMKKLIPACLFMLLSLCALPASAQVVAPPDTLTPINEPIPPDGPVPRSAFIRALIVPGWGHLSMGETRRAAVFIGLQGTSWFMLGKSILRYNDAHSVELGLETLAIDSVEAAMAMSDNRPIGVFDSGIGGLTVVRELLQRLPNEPIVYFGDTARVPYGPKSPATVARYSEEAAAFLLSRDVKLIVIACNTATAHAATRLAELVPVPVIGVIEPGARAAVEATRTGGSA
jgi:hypothetical protein